MRTHTRKNRRQNGGVVFSSNNVEYPELHSPEAPWASSAQNYYTQTSSEISATSLDSIPGLTPAMKSKLQTNGLISEAHLFFIATALSGQKYAFADLLRSIGVKHPVYLADLIGQKVWRLWGVSGVHEGVVSDIDFELGASAPLSDYSKEKIFEYVQDHNLFDMLELLESVGGFKDGLYEYIWNHKRFDLFERLAPIGGSKDDFINTYLEKMYKAKSLTMLDHAPELFTDSMLGAYIREKYGVDAYESFVRSLTDPVQRIRNFIQNNAFERRKHLLPLLPEFQRRAQRRAQRRTRRLRR